MQEERAKVGWQARQAYTLAAICLVLGVTLGYLLRGPATSKSAAVSDATAANSPHAAVPGHPGKMPSLEQMKHMADKQAEPLLAKARLNPNDSSLLVQIGNVYRSAHQFKDASEYYAKALQLDPRNVPIRTELASCLYYVGDVDGALKQLHQALEANPKDANSLFNLGIIEWREKKDAAGALAAWDRLLKANPKLDAAKKTQVQKLIAEVKQQSTQITTTGTTGVPSND